ncbi:tRNA-splicing endonuclease subunit [Sporothrix curviconia]|uniref:tRNA-intron lyase n=1 Tax=Sporothrix curviconia TaxID=1260050 RepID=A0ABP0BG31_9PEZI
MASSSAAVAAERQTTIRRDDPGRETVEMQDNLKIRISNIGGRYLVFDVADVARLRRRHSLCAILVGITPQAPNQNVFSSLPLELTADEVRWLVHERRAAYVADDLQAHLASLAQPATRRAYLESLRQQRQAAQAVADEVAAQRERRGAEVRANMAAKRVDRKTKKAAGKARKEKGPSEAEEPKEPKENEPVKEQPQAEAPSVPPETKGEAPVTAAAVPHKVVVATATDRADDHADAEPLLQPPPRTEEVTQKEDALIFGGLVEVERMKAERDRQTSAVQQRQQRQQRQEETRKTAPLPTAIASRSPLVKVTPTTSDGLVGYDDEVDNDNNADAVAPAPVSTLSPSAQSAASLRAHLANRGYYTTPGLRFGGALSVYPGDPFRYHAHFVATTYGWDQPIQLLDIVSQGRLATSVKKGLLIGSAKPAETENGQNGGGSGAGIDANVRTFTLEWAAI